MRFKKMLLPLLALILLTAVPAAAKPKLYSVSSGLMYMRVTEVIPNDKLLTDGGVEKKPTKGNTFAQIMVNFANLTDKPVKDFGLNPVTLSVSPENLYLVGQSGKLYSGMNATKFLKKDLKPFLGKITLKPGEDAVRAMAFHVPRNDRILGVMYNFEGGLKLVVDYTDPEHLQK